jgi:hypothetical protein
MQVEFGKFVSIAKAVCVVVVLFVVAGTWLIAEEKEQKGQNVIPASEITAAKPTAASQGVSDLALAHSLIRWGREHKSPESLITAAKILAGISAKEIKMEPETKASGADVQKPEKPIQKTPVDNSPKALLDEARAMSDAPHIAALADAVASQLEERKRGAASGPRMWKAVLPALSRHTYRVTFRGGEIASVAISGDGDTDLDLYVYDQFGNLIGVDNDYTDDCIVTWIPRWTGPFIIEVVNRGPVYNEYVAAHN